MFYVKYNANPKGRNIRDCVVRAVSLAFDKDYYIAYQELTFHALMERQGWLFNYPESYSGYLEEMGCIELESFKVGRRKARVDDLYNHEYFKSGTYLVQTKDHLTVVKDNHLYDTWDCGREVIHRIWEVKDV